METIKEYKCPCCGGAIAFDSESQKLKCPYCDTEFEIETLKSFEEDLGSDSSDSLEWGSEPSSAWQEKEAEGMKIYSCKSCSGEIIGDETTAATSCPYCGNPVIFTKQLSDDLRPDKIIPFKIDKKSAKEALKKHFKGKKLLPKVFSTEVHLDETKGIYIPFWLFSADTDSTVRYRGTQVRFWSDSKYNYTQTNHFSLVRGGTLGFERIPVDGSTKMADDLMESLEPYYFGDAVDFDTAYLAGYLADRYDVPAAECISRANERIKRSVSDEFMRTTSAFSGVHEESNSVRLSNSSSQYALYPVWILSTSWNGKNYIFVMNGQTGKLVGDLPMDTSVFFKWLFGISGISSLISFLILTLIWFI